MDQSTQTPAAASQLTGFKPDDIIQSALQEDIGREDITTNSIIPETKNGRAVWRAKQDGVIAGLFIGEKVFHSIDNNIKCIRQAQEGQTVNVGDTLVEIKGSARALLTGERTALNFVQRLSGIATKTARFVKQLEGTKTQILDTRKTLPGFRRLDKYAVRTGGGKNHRMGLFDMALIKENHITAAGSIAGAVESVRGSNSTVKIEVETTTLNEVQEALSAGADMIMLDNMTTDEMTCAVNIVDRQALTEASGNITLNRLAAVAECGVDYISAGALTHSIKAFDISQTIV